MSSYSGWYLILLVALAYELGGFVFKKWPTLSQVIKKSERKYQVLYGVTTAGLVILFFHLVLQWF